MASKLNKRELAVRTFIISVFKKEINITSTVFRKVITTFADTRNKEIVEKYGERIYSSMLAMYKFKNHNDYTTKMNLLKSSAYLDTGLTQYGQNHSIITKKLFDSDSVKTEWIIEDMGASGSLAEVNHIIAFLFTRERENLSEMLYKVISDTEGTKSYHNVLSTILKNAIYDNKFRDTGIITQILDKPFKDTDADTVRSIVTYYRNARGHKSVLELIRNWLYKQTNDEEFLAQEAKDVFLF